MRAFALKDAADQRERSRRHVAALAIPLIVNIAFVFALFVLMRVAPPDATRLRTESRPHNGKHRG
jgi:hypothetical protein